MKKKLIFLFILCNTYLFSNNINLTKKDLIIKLHKYEKIIKTLKKENKCLLKANTKEEKTKCILKNSTEKKETKKVNTKKLVMKIKQTLNQFLNNKIKLFKLILKVHPDKKNILVPKIKNLTNIKQCINKTNDLKKIKKCTQKYGIGLGLIKLKLIYQE